MTTKKKRPTLADVVAYENPRVIASFLKAYDVTEEIANDIFYQLKSMLWLVNEMEFDGLRSEGKFFSIDHSLVIIDEMWHTFILFTFEYQEFCLAKFGRFMHHYPTIETEAEHIAGVAELAGLTKEQVIAKIAEKKRWQYIYVYDKLGENTFSKWYVDFHKKYTLQSLIKLKSSRIEKQINTFNKPTKKEGEAVT